MFYITINILPSGADGYKLDVSTNLPEEDLIKKILEETLEMWGERTSEGFDDDPYDPDEDEEY